MAKTVSDILASKPARRKPSAKNLPYVFWEAWRTGHFDTYERDPGPLKGVMVVKVKSMLSKLEDMAARPLSGFTVDAEFVQQFAQWITTNWDETQARMKQETGFKTVTELPTLGVVVVHAAAFVTAYLNRDKGMALNPNAKPGW